MSVFGIKSNKCKQEVVPASQVFDVVYPVGSIYMSVNNVNPATLFGGTWEKIEGKFLLGASSGHSLGETGGAEKVNYTPAGSVGNHTLTAAEMPAHTHTYAKSAAATGSTALTADQIPAHNHSYNAPQANTGSTALTTSQIPAHTHDFVDWMPTTEGSLSATLARGTDYKSWGVNHVTKSTGGGAGHTHTMPTSSASTGNKGGSGGHTHSISTASTASGSAGSGGAHNHGFTGSQAQISTMSPYLSVNMWKRTA